MNEYGFDKVAWMKAKQEAMMLMIVKAKEQSVISYSELVQQIRSITLDPQDPRLRNLLCEISAEEERAGRGMLSAVVVHKSGDRQPGPGFYEFAEEIGKKVTDKTEFWVRELTKVYDYWNK
jgi:hypothetical protein